MTSTRRNGQALPCEPCRKAKIRCDGATPTCQNCVRRNKGDSCAYTPVPASRTWYSDNAPSPTASPRPQTAQPRPDSAALQNRASFNAGDDKLSFDFATNNSATFSDIGDQFKRSLVIDAPSAARPDTKQIQLGARLLTLLFEHFALYERLSETAVEVWPEGCVLGHRLVSGMFEALEDLHGSLAADAKDLQSSLLRWSQKIFEDSSKPLAVQPTMSPDDYIRRISGRWEGIGLVFTIVGQGAMLERDWRSIRSSEANVPRDQKSLAAQAISASDACLQFCDLSTAVNDPLGWLLFQHIHLLTLLCGENGMCLFGLCLRRWGTVLIRI